MINNTDAVRLIDNNREDAVVIPTMNAGNVRFGLPSITSNQDLDLPISGAMGKASNVGLGVALAQPGRKVFVLDGDGSLLMNLGALVTTSTKAPKNFYHFLFNNGVYAVTGGQPIPGSEGVTNWEEIARGAGYAAVFSFDNLEDFTTGIGEVLAAEGPVFIHLAVEPEIENTPVQFRQRASRTSQQAYQEVTAALAGDN